MVSFGTVSSTLLSTGDVFGDGGLVTVIAARAVRVGCLQVMTEKRKEASPVSGLFRMNLRVMSVTSA